MNRQYGKNYYLSVKLHETGLNGSDIGRKLGISRERVRQLLCVHRNETTNFKKQGNSITADPRICSKCDKYFTPRTRFQNTCGCKLSRIADCSVCGKPSLQEKGRKYTYCDNPNCFDTIKLRITKSRKEGALSRNHTPTTVECPICHKKHTTYLWLARIRNFKIRCLGCKQAQAKTLCQVCQAPSSSKTGRCKQHAKVSHPSLKS